MTIYFIILFILNFKQVLTGLNMYQRVLTCISEFYLFRHKKQKGLNMSTCFTHESVKSKHETC